MARQFEKHKIVSNEILTQDVLKCIIISYNRNGFDFTEAGLRDINPTGICKTTRGWSSSNNDDLERTKQSNVLSEVV